MRTTTLELLAKAMIKRLKGTALGHCARVDYFDRQQAIELCTVIEHEARAIAIAVHVLASSDQELTEPRYISTDRAIELRNRKVQRLCLFVPSDLVDAAFSSLANAFAPIDGGQIQREVIDQIYDGLTSTGKSVIRSVRRVLKPPLHLSLNRQLAFYAKVAERDQAQQYDRIGADLWQVGLIADNGADWINRLDRNRTATIRLALPVKIHSSTVERVTSLGVDTATRTELIKFLQNQAVNDVAIWSHRLSERPDLTLDRWVFPQEDPSDLVSITLTPFVNTHGVVEKHSNLKQPDGPHGILYASYGPKESITIKWNCDPPKPRHLEGWRVELVPANDYTPDEDHAVDLPMRLISPSRRSLKLSLDIDLAPDDLPEYPLCVRLTPLDKSGNELRVAAGEDDQEGDKMTAHSQEFYLSNEPTPPKPIKLTRSLRTTPTIAFGRIETLLDAKAGQTLDEREPQWNATRTNFSLRVSDNRLLNLVSSPLLAAIECRAHPKPTEAQRYVIALEQVRPIVDEDVSPCVISSPAGDVWNKWTSARKSFLEALANQAPRNLVAIADWKDLAEIARRYGDAYQRLVADLIEQQASLDIIRDLLSIDTIHIRVQGQYEVEEALIVLPTHPVRAVWMASYTQLLRQWEATLSQVPSKERKRMIDIELLRALEPANIPPFLYHPERAETLLSAGNLGFFYGVYLPAPFVDRERRMADLAFMFGIDHVRSLTTSDIIAAQLTKHLTTFQELHPYVETLALSLVQTHHSPWISEALITMTQRTDSDEESDTAVPPTLALTAYVAHPEMVTGISGMDRVRQLLGERSFRRESDYLRPAIASAIAPLDRLLKDEADEAHIAIIGDLTRPRIVPTAAATSVAGIHSLSVYGLVVRFLSSFTPNREQLCWMDSIALPETLQQEHPVAPRYGNTLLELYRVMQRAGGLIIAHHPDHWPAVMYTLAPQQEQVIRQIHAGAHWVITCDRFFALDYYDSPHQPALQQQSQTYVIDYTPDFTDGIGQRMFITTRWRGEVELLLATAMQELGFDQIDHRVGQVLHSLKTVSGQLALRITQSHTSAAAAVGMGLVTAYLKQRNELEHAVLIPVDSASRPFSHTLIAGTTKGERRYDRTRIEGTTKGERHCAMLLLAIKRNTIDATFIEVTWRHGTSSLDSLATEMEAQMRMTAESVRSRYFTIDRSSKEPSDSRVDGVLQRAHFGTIVRFYVERARRYGLLTDEAYTNFTQHLRSIERPSYEFRPKYRGFIITREKINTSPIHIGEAVIEVITASDIAAFAASPAAPRENPQWRAKNERTTDTSLPALSRDAATVLLQATDPPPQPPIRDDRGSVPASEGKALEGSAQTTPKQSPNIHTPPQEVVITLGETSRGPVDWKPSVRGSPHLFIIGIPGQGKSVTTNHILGALARQQVPALVLDFHGQFGDPSGTFVAGSGGQRVDAAEGLPFSPFEVMVQNGKTDWKQNSAVLADIFAYVVGLGGIQKDVLLNAIQDAYRACGYAAEHTGERTLPTSEQVLKHIEQREHKQKVRNVAARCRPLLEMDLFKPASNESTLLAQIRQGLVIDLHNLMSETLQLAAGAFVLRKLYRDMFTWGQASRLKLAIVLDEAHRLAKDVTLPKLMKEGRKYGISVIVASQGLSDFHPDILGNAGTKIIFRTNYPDSKQIAPYIQSRNPQNTTAQIEQLPVGNAFVQTPEMQQGLVVHMRSSEP